MGHWIVGGIALWAAVGALFTLASLVGARRLWRRAHGRAAPVRWPRVAVLRPCDGAEAELAENLASSAMAAYGGERSVYLLVPSAGDGAHAAAEEARARAAAAAPSVRVEVVVTGVATTANRKAAQLAVGAARAGDAEVVVSADSDVRFDDGTLAALVAALDDGERIGAASGPPVEVGATTLADRLSSTLLSSSQQSFLALSGLASLGGSIPQVGGALVALRAEVLPLLDGFRALEPFLGEDFELTMRLHRAGWRVGTAGTIARCRDAGRTLGEVVGRFARWALVVRRQRPALFPTYFLLLGCTPLVALALGVALAGSAGGRKERVAAAVAVGALVTLRTALAVTLRRREGMPPGVGRALGAFLVGESLLVAAAARALVMRHIVWRGRRYRVARGGRLESIAQTTANAR